MDITGWQERLDDACARWRVPGAQLGVVRDGQREVLCSGAIAEGGTPVGADTAFHAGSLAKSLTGLVVLDAARRGELDLDAPCSDQAPGLWDDTPRQLLAQTTGRPNLLPGPTEQLADFVATVGEMPRVHEQGRFSYCNAGWSVLDLLLSLRTGSGFEQRAAEVVGDLTSWRPVLGMPEGASVPHAIAPDGTRRVVPATYSPAASAAGSQWWATADQLLDWAQVQLTPPPGWEEPVAGVRSPGATLPGSTVFDSWGHGWALWDRGDHQAFGWAGFTGGHRAYLRCFPDQDGAVVLLANAAGPLFGPPGGSALFDDLLPDVLDLPTCPPSLQRPRTARRCRPPTWSVATVRSRSRPTRTTATPWSSARSSWERTDRCTTDAGPRRPSRSRAIRLAAHRSPSTATSPTSDHLPCHTTERSRGRAAASRLGSRGSRNHS